MENLSSHKVVVSIVAVVISANTFAGQGIAVANREGSYWVDARPSVAESQVNAINGAPDFMRGATQSRAILVSTFDRKGYWAIDRSGGISAYGESAQAIAGRGCTTVEVCAVNRNSKRFSGDVLSATPSPDGKGLWVLSSTGSVYGIGTAKWLGDYVTGAKKEPPVAILATWDNKGYYIIGNKGGVFRWGTAKFYGSTGGNSTSPIVDAALRYDEQAHENGYWMVKEDGSVETFGGAPLPSVSLGPNDEITGMDTLPGGDGYVASKINHVQHTYSICTSDAVRCVDFSSSQVGTSADSSILKSPF
jgi:hypothetical protein